MNPFNENYSSWARFDPTSFDSAALKLCLLNADKSLWNREEKKEGCEIVQLFSIVHRGVDAIYLVFG
jgi:hypothetical protein